jgi:nucleoside-diphosphate-sugar epimerase
MDTTSHKYKALDFKNALVIGGAGMLGYEIANQLLNQGKQVRILDLVPSNDRRFEDIIGDIRNPLDLIKACEGADVVFQTAAEVWDPKKSPSSYEEVNITGNMNVINACNKMKVGRLVYSSTLDVVVDGTKPITDGDESLPYPRKEPKDPYCRTKIIAEKLMIEANCDKLMTCAIRPVGIYGPRDKYHLTNIIKAALNGSNFRLGNGSARFSHVYSENAAHAHVLASKYLVKGSPVPGSYYFIADHYPAQNLFDFMEPFLVGLGFEPSKRSIPYPVAYLLAWINEKINPSSNFNRFAVIQTCVDHTFIYGKASHDFGYKPIISEEEAFERTLGWFKDNMKDII